MSTDTSLLNRVAGAIGELGLWNVSRNLTRREPRIFMYHRFCGPPTSRKVDRQSFRNQLQELSRRFECIDFSELVRRRRLGVPVARSRPVVCLTVDDGYRDFYEHAWPVLREYKVPCTVFVTVGFIAGEQWLWADELE